MTPVLTTPRARLNRDRVLQAAVEIADEIGIEALSMRRLAKDLGVVPMALYKHVANKEELLDAMVEVIVSEIDPPISTTDWKRTVRLRITSARQVLIRHPWARPVLESRTNHTPTVLDYMESTIGMFLAGGFSADLTHHVMHALGSRMWGFTQELFDKTASSGSAAEAETFSEVQSAQTLAMAQRYPNIAHIRGAAAHDATVVAHGCDDKFEFEFALDLLLDGFERLHQTGWSSAAVKLRV